MRRIDVGTLAALCLALLAAAGCAGQAGRGATPEEWVMQRAQQRWDLLLAGDVNGAYQLLAPGQRTVMSPQAYERKVMQSRVRWVAAEVLAAECAPEVCTVQVKLGLRLVSPAPGVPRYDIDREVEEDWIQVDRQWWFVP